MAGFTVERDVGTDIVTCRIDGFLSDADAELLVVRLKQEVQIARGKGTPMRLVFDNRLGSVFSATATQALMQMKPAYHPQDRIAVLISDTLHKLQTKRNSSDGTETFASEPEAIAWLGAAAG